MVESQISWDENGEPFITPVHRSLVQDFRDGAVIRDDDAHLTATEKSGAQPIPKIARPLKLTLKAEMEDGSIRDVIIPLFYLPAHMQFIGKEGGSRTLAKRSYPDWPARFYALYPNGVPESALTELRRDS